MLQSLIIISACIFGVKSYEVNDENYFLSTTGSPVIINALEDVRNNCENSWLLEVYDENVATLLKKLNVNIQQNRILLGMKRGTNSWRWSDGTNCKLSIVFSGTVHNQTDPSRVLASVTNNNNQVYFSAKAIFDSAGVICSKVSTKDKCTEWFHNGLCYFKPTTTNYQWFEAHNECITNGASMATFNNSETNLNTSFIDNKFYWISLSRNTWNWTHAGDAVTFNKWSSGHPVFNDDQYCASTNSIGNDWKSVGCSGTYYIVCMRENQKLATTQSSLPTPGANNDIISITLKYQPIEDSLSIGAKAGIGIGVSMLLIIIIIIVGVLGFKYFHHSKKAFQRKTSKTQTDPEDTYSVVANNNRQTISPDITSHQLEYADLDFKKHCEDNIKSAENIL